MHARNDRGFTLVELMITFLVFVVLMMVAAPQWAPLLQRQRLKNATMDIAASVILARSEAIKRNANVYIVATSTDWSKGWTVSNAATVSAASTLRTIAALNGIQINEANSNTTLNFGGDGRMQGTGMTFSVTPTVTSQGQQPYCVSVGATGRVQTTQGACS
jgi:type IV fimbrial biogenesis protein FimT